MDDRIFESPFPSEASVPEPEYDRDFVPVFPPDFDDEQDKFATQVLLDSLGNPEEGWNWCL